MFGMEDLTEPQEMQDKTTISYFMLSLMQIADQAKIIHWQTQSNLEHRYFGKFYDKFIEQMDTLVEAIAGKYGSQNLKFGEAAIMIYDYEMAMPVFFELVNDALRGTFKDLFDREEDSELYALADEILDLSNKTQYLLQHK